MQSLCSDRSPSTPTARVLSVTARSPSAVDLVSLNPARAFFSCLSSLLFCLISSVRDCLIREKLNAASFSVLRAEARWASALSIRSSKISMMACIPSLSLCSLLRLRTAAFRSNELSSWAACCACMKASSGALSCWESTEASTMVERVLASSRPPEPACRKPLAWSCLRVLMARSMVSMVSAKFESWADHSSCSRFLTSEFFSSSASASEMAEARSAILLSAVCTSAVAFSITAVRLSTIDTPFLISYCFCLAFSSHHSTNFSYWACSTSPSCTTFPCSCVSSCSTFSTGFPAAAAQAKLNTMRILVRIPPRLVGRARWRTLPAPRGGNGVLRDNRVARLGSLQMGRSGPRSLGGGGAAMH
mmetsp:Transcript_42422/g.102127  ORF Transcript_42422/g.102127 Transcript_42422/m.102127 type:complete len:361 (-) Transcript_42422:23-1105(-)